MKKIIVKKGQNIYDIAIQEYGNAEEGVMQLWRDNPKIGIFSDLQPGQELNIDLSLISNQEVVDLFTDSVNTGSNTLTILERIHLSTLPPEGIPADDEEWKLY